MIRKLFAIAVAAGIAGPSTVLAADGDTPAGQGFGEAALALGPKFRTLLWSEDGLPLVGGVLKLPIRYAPAAGAQ